MMLALVVTAQVSKAQETIVWSPDMTLDFNGFRINNDLEASGGSHASLTFVKNRKHLKLGNTTYHYIDVNAGLMPYQSWVKEGHADQEELKDIKGQLNALQQMARECRNDLLFAADKNTTAIENKYIRAFSELRDSLQTNGALADYVIGDETFDITTIKFKEAATGIRTTVGLYSDLALSDMSRLVYPATGLYVAYTYERKADFISADVRLGICVVNKNLLDTWNSIPHLNLSVNYGRYVSLGNMRTALSCGVGYSAWRMGDGIFGGPALFEGAYADLPLSTSISLTPGTNNISRRSLKLGLYLSQTMNLLKGGVIPTAGIYVGMSFNNRKISRI